MTADRSPLTDAQVATWADAWLEAQRNPSLLDVEHPQWWAVEDLMLPSDTDPEDAWRVVLAILARGPGEDALGMLAAGPLEDLVEVHGAQFIDRIEAQAQRDPAFRALMRGVWESGEPGIWLRFVQARGGV